MGLVSFTAPHPVPCERGNPMISSHALPILVLLLAVACVLMGSALVYLQRRIDRGIAAVNERLNALERPDATVQAEVAR